MLGSQVFRSRSLRLVVLRLQPRYLLTLAQACVLRSQQSSSEDQVYSLFIDKPHHAFSR